MISDDRIASLATELSSVDGVVGVALGGSRARGLAHPDSDVDLGVYLADDVDDTALRALSSRWSSEPAEWTQSGGWGPWVDGGAWLQVDGTAVDLIRRQLQRVDDVWQRAEQGEYAFWPQAGHPLGFLDVSYCGELAVARILADPQSELQRRRQRMVRMPDQLGQAFVAGVWEATFLVHAAAKVAGRGDAAYVGQCLSRAVLLCAHGIHGAARTWATNEKGLVHSAARLPPAPDDFARLASAALASGDASPAALRESIERSRVLVDAVRARID